MIVTRTRSQAIGFLRFARYTLRLNTAHVEVRHIASDGDIVFTDRIDHLLTPNRRVIASLPVVGVMTICNGQISEWKEHFSAAVLVRELATHAVRPTYLR